ncbi:TPA: RNA polymerase subunit sigma-70, partial [Streptococcus suis]
MGIKLDQYEKEVIGIAEEISYYLQKSGANY